MTIGYSSCLKTSSDLSNKLTREDVELDLNCLNHNAYISVFQFLYGLRFIHCKHIYLSVIIPCDDCMSIFAENTLLCELLSCRNHKGSRGSSTRQAVEVKAVGHIVDQDVPIDRTDTNVATALDFQFNFFVLGRHHLHR